MSKTDEKGPSSPLEDLGLDAQDMDHRRRQWLKRLALAAAATQLPRSNWGHATTTASTGADDFSDIEHVVVLMMENRSFDHLLGWVPGADGRQQGRSFANDSGEVFHSSRLTDTQSAWGGNPAHSYQAGRTCYDDGAMDGFLRTESAGVGGDGSAEKQQDTFPIDYFDRESVPFYAGCADYFTVGDRYFTGLLGPTLPNRIYMHSGETDRLSTKRPSGKFGLLCHLSTIWDRAHAAKVSHRYYFSDLPLTALWGLKHLGISRLKSEFFADAAAGRLPSISFIDPSFIGESKGLSNDDHPIANISNGQAFLNSVYEALRTSPQWANTLLIVNYDEWGGFADHVPPPLAPVSEREANLEGGGNDGRLGIRVPLVLIGPRARRNAASGGGSAVVSEQYDPNAILNFIGQRFRLESLGIRALSSGNIASALLPLAAADFSVPPAFKVPEVNRRQVQAKAMSLDAMRPIAELDEHLQELKQLQDLARHYGFPQAGMQL